MRVLVALLLLGVAVSARAGMAVTHCKEHPHTLSVQPVGKEHVNHRVTLNRKTHVTELEKGMWFVESVTCTSHGFVLDASHAQYSDPTRRRFHLTVRPKDGYDLK